jgi:hypothetical protein
MARVPYGPPIQDAIAGGDLAEMKALVGEAEQHLREFGDVRVSLELLKLEIAKREGSSRRPGGPQPPYGTAIHEAIARGDLAEMKSLLKRAEDFLSRQAEVATALPLLKGEIARLEEK